MKKNLLIIAMFVLASTVTINCSKKADEVVTCTNLADIAQAKGLEYSLDPIPSKCLAYKTALTNFRNCPALTEAQRQQIDAVLPLLIC